MEKYIGIDGSSDGWLAVIYHGNSFKDCLLEPNIETIWKSHSDAKTFLIDIPIGLPESSNPRKCDVEARNRLDGHRTSSVFPVPIRKATRQDNYEAAKQVQEAQTDGSLNIQSWAICDKIEDVDRFLIKHPEASGTIRESHPEVCFDALNGGHSMRHSKTAESAKAFRERIDVLESIQPDILDLVETVADDVDRSVTNDDILDAFVLALSASPLTGDLHSLPSKRYDDIEELPKQIWYTNQK